MSNDVDKIRKLLKNINDDDEIDEIHEILDRLDGSAILSNSRIDGQVAAIVKNGMVQEIEINNNNSFTTQIGGGSVGYPSGPIECHITFVADPRDIYDD